LRQAKEKVVFEKAPRHRRGAFFVGWSLIAHLPARWSKSFWDVDMLIETSPTVTSYDIFGTMPVEHIDNNKLHKRRYSDE
jgi:hypothetical protein